MNWKYSTIANWELQIYYETASAVSENLLFDMLHPDIHLSNVFFPETQIT